MRGGTFLGLLVACALAITACGDSDSPEGVVESLFDAAVAGDGDKVCELLSPEGLESLSYESVEECAADVSSTPEEERAGRELESAEQLVGETEECGPIEESETEAEVLATFTDGETECVNLSKIDDEWRINDL